MSSWVTDETGKWHPAKERVSLVNRSGKTMRIKSKDINGNEFVQEIQPGHEYIYEGPDRAALFDLWEAHGKPTEEQIKNNPDKLLTLGTDFRSDGEFQKAYGIARQNHGFNSVDEYLQFLGYDKEATKKRFEEKASVVNVHTMPSRVEEIKKLGGGYDRAAPGKNLRYGGFGDPESI